jgi:hypothetical protein
MYYHFHRFSLFWCVLLWVVTWLLCVVDVLYLWNAWLGAACLMTINFYGEGTGRNLSASFTPFSLPTTDAEGEGVSRASGMSGVSLASPTV